MKKTTTFLISTLMLLVCGGVGFGVTKALRIAMDKNATKTIAENVDYGTTDNIDNNKEESMQEDNDANSSDKTENVNSKVEDMLSKVETAEQTKKTEPASEPAKPAAAPPKMSYEELTSIINNRSNNNYPRNISIRYTNLDAENGEEAQTSIANIRSYIRTGVWRSVTVVGATYDENTGKPTSITLQINR